MFGPRKGVLSINPGGSAEFQVQYIGFVETYKATGVGCTTLPVQKIWDSAPEEQYLRFATIIIGPNGIQVKFLDRRKPQDLIYNIKDVAYICAQRDIHDRIFSWICNSPLKERTLECHAVLCSSKEKAQTISLVTSRAFHIAYRDWKLEKERQFRMRYSSMKSFSSDYYRTDSLFSYTTQSSIGSLTSTDSNQMRNKHYQSNDNDKKGDTYIANGNNFNNPYSSMSLHSASRMDHTDSVTSNGFRNNKITNKQKSLQDTSNNVNGSTRQLTTDFGENSRNKRTFQYLSRNTYLKQQMNNFSESSHSSKEKNTQPSDNAKVSSQIKNGFEESSVKNEMNSHNSKDHNTTVLSSPQMNIDFTESGTNSQDANDKILISMKQMNIVEEEEVSLTENNLNGYYTNELINEEECVDHL